MAVLNMFLALCLGLVLVVFGGCGSTVLTCGEKKNYMISPSINIQTPA